MDYPKAVMTTSELKEMGFTRTYLERAYHSKCNNFATKVDPSKEKSTIIFDTAGFEAWRQKEIKAQKGRA